MATIIDVYMRRGAVSERERAEIEVELKCSVVQKYNAYFFTRM